MIRAPFRILAALVCLFSVVALLARGYMAWKDVQSPLAKDVMMVPGVLWLLRLAFYAALRGNVPEDSNWPFASSQVAAGYLLSVMLVQRWI